MRPEAMRTVMVAVLSGVGVCACAAPAGGAIPAVVPPVAEVTLREGSYQRFIVKYRDGTEPSRDEQGAQRRLQATAPSGIGVNWQQRLGVQADLFLTDRPLDAREAEALMSRFRADPDVEYIEPETMMHIDPIRPGDLPRTSD